MSSSLRHWRDFCGLAPKLDRQLGDADRMFPICFAIFSGGVSEPEESFSTLSA